MRLIVVGILLYSALQIFMGEAEFIKETLLYIFILAACIIFLIGFFKTITVAIKG